MRGCVARLGRRSVLLAALTASSMLVADAAQAGEYGFRSYGAKGVSRPASPPLVSAQPGTLSPAQLSLAAQAAAAADRQQWAAADAIARSVGDPLVVDLIAWRRYLEGEDLPSFSELAAFLTRHPDWPRQEALLFKAERALARERGYHDVLAWFASHPPVSGEGMVLSGEALIAVGRRAEGEALIRRAWIEQDLPLALEQEIALRHQRLLGRAEHEARLDRLLWEGKTSAAARMLPRVGPDWRQLAEARLALMSGRPGIDGLVARVPAHLQFNSGLLYERARWRSRKGSDFGVIEVLRLAARAPAGYEDGDKWWRERQRAARGAIERRDYRLAYELASQHRQREGASFADAEWLSGWLALRFLNDPQAASQHFARMYAAVSRPISRARGAYWAGRAASALGRGEEAQRWYAAAAQYPATFYGQLAAEALGTAAQLRLAPAPQPDPATRAAFAARESVRAAQLLRDLGEVDTLRAFIETLGAQADQPAEWVLLAQIAGGLGRTELGVWLGRQASYAGVSLPEAYPIADLPVDVGLLRVEPALVLALVRQESNFNISAVSSAGARGLMQLMPGTAREVARWVNLSYQESRLTRDGQYNMKLGAAYVSRLIEDHRGAYALAVAAYNAGPGRVREWIALYGDPRDPRVDMIDWIEQIPIEETRNYVQRVLESVQVYRQRLNSDHVPMQLEADLARGSYAAANGRRGISG